MKHFSGYGAYLLFLALKTHFNSAKYDFFRMHGKTRASRESFDRRTDRSFFEKLAKRYDAEELKFFFLANLLEGRQYITDMLDEDAHGFYFDLEKRRQALTYHFSTEIDRVFIHPKPFAVSPSEYPPVVLLHLRKIVSIETLVILDDLTKFTSKFDEHYAEDIIWPKLSLKVRKFRPFLKYDKQRMKAILKEKIYEREASKEVSAEAPSYRAPSENLRYHYG